MRFCKKCILPETRPGLVIGEDGVCNGCKNSLLKSEAIDWSMREKEFLKVVENAKARSKGYDCLIPVSGGKDSTWQVIKCLEYSLNPLAVTWKAPSRTRLGQENLDNLVRLGVDHIDYQINPEVEKKFLYKAYVKYGETGIPMHMAIFSIPLTIAVKFDIHLIVWGENSAFEYGSTDENLTGFLLDDKWRKQFGVTHGTIAEDWIDDDLSRKDLIAYSAPENEVLEQKNVLAIFLGYYFKWDVQTSLRVAKEHGFKANKNGPKVGFYNYADIDDDFISIHHYLKWYKFGMTRSFDNLSLEIRNGRMTRDEALIKLKELGDQCPHSDIEKFCEFIGITKEHFFEIAETFRNHDIWRKVDGVWKIEDFIISDWRWQ